MNKNARKSSDPASVLTSSHLPRKLNFPWLTFCWCNNCDIQFILLSMDEHAVVLVIRQRALIWVWQKVSFLHRDKWVLFQSFLSHTTFSALLLLLPCSAINVQSTYAFQVEAHDENFIISSIHFLSTINVNLSEGLRPFRKLSPLFNRTLFTDSLYILFIFMTRATFRLKGFKFFIQSLTIEISFVSFFSKFLTRYTDTVCLLTRFSISHP